MRVRTALAAPAALAVLASPYPPLLTAHAAPGPTAVAPTCGDPAAAVFPIRTRIAGGPAEYRAGAAPRTWYVELTNTTRRTCRTIHPVIVLADRSGALAPEAVRLAFATAPGAAVRPVRMEPTDHRELVGVLDDAGDRAFTGFTVPANGTVRVPVSLAFTAAARPDRVTATAAVVQRRGDDGDWVGTSAPYAFTVTAPAGPAETARPDPPRREPSPGPVRSAAPPDATASGPARTPGPAAPATIPAPASDAPEELAGTGRRRASHLVPLAAAAAACLAVGAAAVTLTRRRP
ncbi:hypothetical protein [Streptomyces sp. NPDC050585]|uniref:hypothetical protein n=1 Tax=Streptomyces sp. NPDC050585 TaxID=3365632 RepID=UPI0037BC1547